MAQLRMVWKNKEPAPVKLKEGCYVVDRSTDKFTKEQLADGWIDACIELTGGTPWTREQFEKYVEIKNSNKYEIVSSGVYWLQGESDLTMDPTLYKELKPNDKCPCGSNKKYKKCCKFEIERLSLEKQ